jgi:crotonobetainyl-CoA:carnitine CoA-transferase CaiB-like acyl-CoA transferase
MPVKSPFSNLKVLDLSRLLPGPYCTMLLGDMGAEVIKIEDPFLGDYFRNWQPLKNKNSVFFIAVNRNKKSVTLNLKTEKGKEIFYKLVKDADIVVESFRPGVAKKLGVDFDTLKSIKDDIIYCSITGYGQNTVLSKKAGHDLNYLALSGILSLSGCRNKKPAVLGIQIADMAGAIIGIIGILTALYNREKGVKAQYIDAAMLDGLFSFLSMVGGKYFSDNLIPDIADNLFNGGFACYNIYETKDNRFFTVAAIEDKFWNRFCEVIEKDEWKKLNTVEEEQGRLIDELTDIFKQKTFDEWKKIFENEDICVEPVLNLEESFNQSYVKDREITFKISKSVDGETLHIKNPLEISSIDFDTRSHPQIGENTEEIILKLGYSKEDLQKLKEESII